LPPCDGVFGRASSRASMFTLALLWFTLAAWAGTVVLHEREQSLRRRLRARVRGARRPRPE
jgi:hypothetical protein